MDGVNKLTKHLISSNGKSNSLEYRMSSRKGERKLKMSYIRTIYVRVNLLRVIVCLEHKM